MALLFIFKLTPFHEQLPATIAVVVAATSKDLNTVFFFFQNNKAACLWDFFLFSLSLDFYFNLYVSILTHYSLKD